MTRVLVADDASFMRQMIRDIKKLQPPTAKYLLGSMNISTSPHAEECLNNKQRYLKHARGYCFNCFAWFVVSININLE